MVYAVEFQLVDGLLNRGWILGFLWFYSVHAGAGIVLCWVSFKNLLLFGINKRLALALYSERYWRHCTV